MGDYKSRKEAAWAISNLCSGGNADQVGYLVNQGGVSPVCEVLKMEDQKMIKVALDTLENMLKHAQEDSGENKWADLVEECGGLDTIENLQEHANDEIYQKSLSLLEIYFGDDEGEEGDEGAPAQNMFQGFSQQPVQQSMQQQPTFNFNF
jgi:hypothetical protein